MKPRLKKAFTLIECVLAISISALVMFGGAALLFNIWGLGELLERGGGLKAHADGVESFLRAQFAGSSIADTSALGETFASNDDKTIFVAKHPDSMANTEWLLAFGNLYDHPFYVSPTGFSPEKLCWLEFKDGTLSVIWKFISPEVYGEDCAIYKSPISRRVESVAYLYYDDVGSWKEEESLRSTTTVSTMPQYIKLYFRNGEETIARTISLTSFIDGGIK